MSDSCTAQEKSYGDAVTNMVLLAVKEGVDPGPTVANAFRAYRLRVRQDVLGEILGEGQYMTCGFLDWLAAKIEEAEKQE
jgi:hypothetical protein